MLKKLLVLSAIVLLGAQSVLATTEVIRNSANVANIGRIDYAMTYEGTPTAVTALSNIVTTLSNTNNYLTASASGITVTKADEINAYLFAQSHGGDVASVSADIGSGVAGSAKASVTNYGMWGYVTGNYAYAGQYADKIQGDSISLVSNSFNRPAGPGTIGPQAGAGTKATIPNELNPTNAAYIGPVIATTTEYASADSSINSLATSTLSAAYTLNTIYQYAQAGGSSTPLAWPNGMWAMADITKNGKMSVLTDTAGQGLGMNTWARYQFTTNNWMYSAAGANNGNNLQLVGPIVGTTATITTTGDSMGYADPKIMYVNADTALSSSGTPFGVTATANYFTGSSQKGITTATTNPTTSFFGPNSQTFSGARGFFLYSLVNSANPNGVSNGIFY